MRADEFQQIFPLGDKNDAYAQFFVGQSYLKMLTTERVGSGWKQLMNRNITN